MPKIRKIRIEDRKDSRGGGYSRRKFTVAEADAIREEYNTATEKITISSLARKYSVSQPLMYQLIKGQVQEFSQLITKHMMYLFPLLNKFYDLKN